MGGDSAQRSILYGLLSQAGASVANEGEGTGWDVTIAIESQAPEGGPSIVLGGQRGQDPLGWASWPPSADLLAVLLEAQHERVTHREREADLLAGRAEMEREQHRYRTLVEDAPLDIVVLDKAGRFHFMNRHGAEQLGMAPHDIVGKTIWDVFPRSVADEKMAHVLDALERGTSLDVEVLSDVRGQARWFEAVVQPLRCAPSGCDSVLVISRDVTERRARNDALRAARDKAEAESLAKTSFLANMSHELRTPLNAVVGYAQLLLETDLPPLQRRYARTVADSGKMLMSLVTDILDISKIEAGKVSLESVVFDLEELIENAVKEESLRLGPKPVEVVLDYPLELPTSFRGDPVRIRQIIMNLLSNAGKFTAEGAIHVGVQRAASGTAKGDPGSTEHVSIAVRDTGIGVPEDKREAIFEVFTQADSSTTRRYGGTGLGLAIVDRLVRLMAGHVRVESVVGAGSTFTVELPMHVADLAAQPLKLLRERELLQGHSVAVLSDNADFAGSLVRYCESAEMRVMRGMPAALPRVLRTNTDIVLVDVSAASARDALAAASLVRPEGSRHPAIVALTRPSDTRDDRLIDSLTTARLPRPVTRRALLRSLSKIVSQAPDSSEADTGKLLAMQEGLVVLIVEDNLVNQMLVRESLRKLGCTVDLASDGLRGLELARTRRYDLVLMDVQMPVMDGLEAARGIRAHVGTELPIIALTAGALREDIERALQAGMNDVLTKPVDVQALRSKVIRWARRKTVSSQQTRE